MSWRYSLIARAYARMGNTESSLDALRECVRFCIMDAQKTEGFYTAPMIDRLEYGKNFSKNFKGNPEKNYIRLSNQLFRAYGIDKNNNVVFAEGEFECDVTQLIPKSHLDEEGYLIDEKGIKYDLTDADVRVEVGLKDIEIIDNDEDGNVSGEIVSIIYKGDHYQVIIRTEEYDDFVVDTEYTWNEFDKVSIKVDPKKIKLTLKAEVKEYVKD